MSKPKSKSTGCVGCLGIIVIGFIVLGVIGVYQNKVQTEYFSEHREEILTAVRADFEAERYDAVITTASKYSMVADPELERLREDAERLKKEKRVATLRSEIAGTSDLAVKQQKLEELLNLVPTDADARKTLAEIKIPRLKEQLESSDLSVDRRIQLVEELAELEPGNDSWQEQLSDLRATKKRRDDIEEQFSAWDGSHRALTKYVKEQMNDPDSFEHVETKYWDMKDHLIVSMTFRGKNAFGGTVKNIVKAKVSLDGKQLTILETYP